MLFSEGRCSREHRPLIHPLRSAHRHSLRSVHPQRSAHRHSLRSVHPQRSAEVTPRASLQRRFPPTPDAPCPQFRMQFPKHITTIQSTNVEIPPFFNELINIRETKLHARFTKSVSLATNVRSRREGGAVDGAAANERVNTGPNGAARNYAHIHTHGPLNVCMVGLTVR